MIMTNDKYDDTMYTNCTYIITNNTTNYKLGTIKATCNIIHMQHNNGEIPKGEIPEIPVKGEIVPSITISYTPQQIS